MRTLFVLITLLATATASASVVHQLITDQLCGAIDSQLVPQSTGPYPIEKARFVLSRLR